MAIGRHLAQTVDARIGLDDHQIPQLPMPHDGHSNGLHFGNVHIRYISRDYDLFIRRGEFITKCLRPGTMAYQKCLHGHIRILIRDSALMCNLLLETLFGGY